ncbi:unnamed protein product [Bursaphelenchus xylophilus]|uniref:(pine wood nematode) hypothetical protein n=1 Tax=Bursaphelenchus xylophilus TaxID=6326 RepID=A0A7I8WW66_BURXY|nr:unnamed protein product [Bursaphelenchus xylophilus]CAG9118040.1 unnamed protein product [Bursaphelenchus xylophilus]
MRVVVVFLLSVVIVNGQFDESLAKTKLLQLSAGAYTTTPEKCAAVAFGDANEFGYFSACEGAAGPRAFQSSLHSTQYETWHRMRGAAGPEPFKNFKRNHKA